MTSHTSDEEIDSLSRERLLAILKDHTTERWHRFFERCTDNALREYARLHRNALKVGAPCSN